MLNAFSSFMLPVVVILFLVVGLIRKVNVFDAFLCGARKSLLAIYNIAPSLLALTLAVKMLRCSGLLDYFVSITSPLFTKLGIPVEIMPLALLRPISGSGSTALLTDMYETYGPDTKIGLMASVLCCSSETTFYTIAMYFGSCSIKDTRHTIIAALMADVSAVVFSVLFVNLFFNL